MAAVFFAFSSSSLELLSSSLELLSAFLVRGFWPPPAGCLRAAAGLAAGCLGVATGLLEEFLVAPAGLAGASSSELSESELSEELSAAFFAGAGLGVVLETTALTGAFFSSSELESDSSLLSSLLSSGCFFSTAFLGGWVPGDFFGAGADGGGTEL